MRYYTTAQVARLLQVTHSAIRYRAYRYAIGKDIAGRRVYTDTDIQAIKQLIGAKND